MGNGNGGGLTHAKVLTLCATMIMATNGALLWAINEKAKDRYTGTEARGREQLVEEKLNSINYRFYRNENEIQRCLDFIEEHEPHR